MPKQRPHSHYQERHVVDKKMLKDQEEDNNNYSQMQKQKNLDSACTCV